MKQISALERYRGRLAPNVLKDVEAWKADAELCKLASRLQESSAERLLDTYAEVVVARQLLRHGCHVRVEVRTPNGRSADFQMLRGDTRLFIHLKRLNTDSASQK